MAVKLNVKSKKYFVYGKYKLLNGEFANYKKQTEFTSKKKAQEFDKAYKNELEKKQVIDDDLTFNDLVDIFLKSKKFSPQTIVTYKNIGNEINLKVKELNHTTLKKITKDFAYTKIRIIKSILNFAYKHRYIDDKIGDFIIGVKKEKKGTTLFDRNTISEDKNFIFRNKIDLNNTIVFLLESGLRVNEFLSITFDRIKQDSIMIDRQYIKTKNGYGWEKLKSKNSEREIPITEEMRKIINKQQYIENGFLFSGVKYSNGDFLRKKMKENYNTHPHALRHTHASYLIEYSYEVLGYCDKDSIAKHMGHTVAMLENTYKHLFRDKKDDIKKVIEYMYK